MTFLRINRITIKGEDNFILNDIRFTQKKLQKIAIVGETGSGKSTLLKTIAGLIQQDSGDILLQNEKVKGPIEKLVPGHPSIAYLSQYFELPKFLRVDQILSYANKLSDGDARSIYEICQIQHLVNRKTDQLAGGERQRIAIARLLSSSPKLLLLDEPFSHLDMVHKNILKSVISDLSEKLKITCILVSHDPDDTLSWADKIVVMKEGQIIQQGIPKKIYKEPVNEYAAGLFGVYSKLNNDLAREFNNRAGIKKDTTYFFRPEEFEIVSKGKKGIKGKVIQLNYYGGFYTIIVKISDDTIIIKTEDQKINVGDVVYLSRVKP